MLRAARDRERGDWRRTCTLAATIINANPFRGKNAKPVTVDELMRPAKRKMTPAETQARLIKRFNLNPDTFEFPTHAEA